MEEQSSTNRPAATAWWLGLLLVLAVFLAYQPVWHAGFVWDDDEFLTANPTVKSMDLKSPDGLTQAWFKGASLDYYPMTYTLWWLEMRLWGDQSLGYHLVNVLLHAFSAVLLWRVFLRLRIPGAFLAAAIFALHPVNVESIAWISEGKNALAMFFYTTTLLFWLKFDDGGKSKWYGLALIIFALALFSKTAVAPLPVILLGMAWWRRGRVEGKDFWRTVPFFVMSAALSIVTIWFHHHRAFGNEIVRTDNFWSRLAGAGWAIWFYLYKAFLPLNLSFIYPRWEIHAGNVISYVPLILLIAAFVCCWRLGKGIFISFGYFVVMLLPVLGFISIYFMRYSLVADHWQYFAIIGPIALVASVIRNRLAAGALLIALGLLTWNQCRDYANAETLWRATLPKNPNSAMVRNNLSRELLLSGKLDEAINLSESVVTKHPTDFTAHFNLADGYMQKGRFAEAIAQYEKAQELQPANASVAYNMGQVDLKQGQFAAAIDHFNNAIKLQPDYAEAFCNLGYALLQQGHQAEAVAYYQKALEFDPQYALAHNDLGSIYLKMGRADEAMTQFQDATDLQPNFAEAHFNLAELLLARGRLDEAGSQYEESVKARPALAEAHFKLGVIRARQGRLADAMAHYESALKIQPAFARACNNLASLLARSPDLTLRNGQRAVELAQRADQLAQGRNPVFLGTLAAAYAEMGQFDQAVKTIDRALPLAAGDAALSNALKEQAAAYSVKKK